MKKGSKNIEKETKKQKVKIKSIIITIVVLIIIIYAFSMVFNLIKHPTDTFMVNIGEISEEETAKGVLIRDEMLVENKKESNQIIKIKQEGERVAKGDAVYRYYSAKENTLEDKISELNNKIQEALESADNTFSSDKKLLETQIESELNNVYKSNERQEINEYKKNINLYITKKAKIVGDLSPSGSYIKNLMEERSGYEAELEAGSEYITAETSGIVSYRIDGLENVLTINDLGKLNKQFLKDLNLKAGQTVPSTKNSAKIVNNYKCYIIFNSDSEQAKDVEIDDKIKIRVQDNKEVSAKIKNIIEEKDGSRTIAIEIEKQIESLISYREISFDIIWWSAAGFRIPNSAIKKVDGINYVIRSRSGYFDRMPVKILKEGKEYSIVEQYTRSELLELGVSSDNISKYRTITLYDEILLNPTEEQIR